MKKFKELLKIKVTSRFVDVILKILLILPLSVALLDLTNYESINYPLASLREDYDILVTIFYIYLIFVMIWFLFFKRHGFNKFIKSALVLSYVLAVLFFWFRAYDVDFYYQHGSLLELRPQVFNILIFEYIKALVKTITLTGIVFIFWILYGKK